MRKIYQRPQAQALSFKGCELMDTTLNVSGQFSDDPNRIKRRTVGVVRNQPADPIDEEEEQDEAPNRFQLHAYSVWD